MMRGTRSCQPLAPALSSDAARSLWMVPIDGALPLAQLSSAAALSQSLRGIREARDGLS